MENNALLLTVIIPVYNAEKYLSDCLTSLVTQDLPYESYEILCVNDGSKDGSAGIIDRFRETYQNIRVVEQENSGVAVARNTGLAQAAGKYIMFVDSDDFISPNCLGGLINAAEEENADLLTFAYSCTDENTVFSADEKVEFTMETTNVCNRIPPFQVWGVVYRRDLILKTGVHFNSDFRTREDYIFNYLLYQYNLSGKIGYTNAPIYRYRICEGSLSHCMNYRSEAFQKERLSDMLLYIQECKAFLDAHPQASGGTKERIGKGITQFAATALLCALRCRSVKVSDVQKRLKDMGVYPYKLADYSGSLSRAVKLIMTNRPVIFLIDKTKLLQRKTVQE